MSMDVAEFLKGQVEAARIAKEQGISFEEANRLVLADRHKKKKDELILKARLLSEMVDSGVAIMNRL